MAIKKKTDGAAVVVWCTELRSMDTLHNCVRPGVYAPPSRGVRKKYAVQFRKLAHRKSRPSAGPAKTRRGGAFMVPPRAPPYFIVGRTFAAGAKCEARRGSACAIAGVSVAPNRAAPPRYGLTAGRALRPNSGIQGGAGGGRVAVSRRGAAIWYASVRNWTAFRRVFRHAFSPEPAFFVTEIAQTICGLSPEPVFARH